MYLEMNGFLHTNRPSRGGHTLQIAESSKQVAQGQSQAASDKGLHTRVSADLPNTKKQIQRSSQNGRQRNRPQVKEQENSPEEELVEKRQAIYQTESLQ